MKKHKNNNINNILEVYNINNGFRHIIELNNSKMMLIVGMKINI